LARNFQATEGCQLAAVCDTRPAAPELTRKALPGIQVTGDLADTGPENSRHIDYFGDANNTLALPPRSSNRQNVTT
jgi:hypothetical protein